MSERQPVPAEGAQLEAEGPLPVYQRLESIGYGAASFLMASTFVGEVAEAVNNGITKFQAIEGVSAVVMSGLAGRMAVRAHRDTEAYKHATDEERNSPPAMERRYFTRSLRTLAWGSATAVSAEIGLLEAANTVQSGSVKEGLAHAGATAITALIGTKTVAGFRQSRKEQKRLKEIVEANRKANPPSGSVFVSADYQARLDKLASTLVTPERLSS